MAFVDLDTIKLDKEPQSTGGQLVDLSTIKLDSPIDPTAASLAQFQPEKMELPSAEEFKQAGQGAQNLPGQFARGIVGQLPVAGMIAGGALGAPAGPLGAVGGAGMGGAIGAGARGAIQSAMGWRTPPTLPGALQEMGKEGLMGAGAEMAGPIIAGAGPLFGGIQKIISPYAKSTAARITADESTAAAQKLVETAGAQISPNVINPSRAANFFNRLTEGMWPASSIMAKQRGGLQEVADSLQQEFVANRGLFSTSRAGANAAWDNWVNLAGGSGAPYELPKTLQVINEASKKPFAMELKSVTDAAGNIVKQEVPMGTFWKKHIATFKQSLEQNRQVTVQEIRDLLNVLNPTASKGAERTARMKIGEALMEDLSASGNQEMVDALANARDLARLQRIAAPLQSLFNKATIAPTKAGEVEAFNPASFVNQWNQRREIFLNNKNYSAEDIRVIDAFAVKMKAIVPDLQKAAQFTPSYSLQGIGQMNLQNPLGIIAGVAKYPVLAAPVGIDTGLAYSLMNPNGVLRRFLTTGFKPPVLSTKVGIMEAMEQAND